jgi:predicted ATPase
MLTRFRMTNYRSHADSTIPLAPITLLVGPAGAGKSNVFRGLLLLQNSIHRTLPELFPPGLNEFQWVRSRWAGVTDPITLEADVTELDDFPGEAARYSLVIGEAPQGLYIVSESLQRQSDNDSAWQWVFLRRSKPATLGEFGPVDPYDPSLLHKVWHKLVPQPDSQNARFARAVARALSSFGYYHLEVSALKGVGTGESADRIGYYGRGLPDFIAWTKSDPEGAPIFAAILAKLKELLPEVKDLLVTQVNPDQQGLAIQCQGHTGYITARDLSDGTLFTLGLLAIVLSPRRPNLLCLEEPETGLHPRRLRWLFDHLMGVAYPRENAKRTQVLLTTHSPDVVNFFDDMKDSVLVVEAKEGRTRVRALPEIMAQIHQPIDAEGPIGHAWATGLYEGL